MFYYLWFLERLDALLGIIGEYTIRLARLTIRSEVALMMNLREGNHFDRAKIAMSKARSPLMDWPDGDAV
jgi:hypothetical protein